MKIKHLFIGFVCLTIFGCSNDVKDPKQHNTDPPKPVQKAVKVNFNADSAYKYVADQVAFGPRVPYTSAHSKTVLYLRKRLAEFCDTAYIMSGQHTNDHQEVISVSNVMGRFNIDNPKRFVLAAHWDTRPQADEDPENATTPADGANDGASGVGILIEIARQLQILNPSLGIDIIFFDQEDGGESGGDPDTWCIGSQNWGDMALNSDYEAQNGILLDMVGAKGATFAHELYSVEFNHGLLLETWKTGQSLGYGSFFRNIQGGMITDDHVYMSRYAGVPSIDIIHHDLNTRNRFPDHWHKHTDNMDVIDPKTLKAVGHTVLQVVMNHN